MRKTVAWLIAGGLAVAGCAPAPTGTPDRQIHVVASTDVWGSVASAVTGEHAQVTSILSNTTADPHSFEASPADAAEITDASLVIYNGGGYDHWVDDVLSTHPNLDTVDAYSLVDAASLREPNPPNEHVFYDLPTVKAVSAKIAKQMAAADPANASSYQANSAQLDQRLDDIAADERAIRQAHPSAAVLAAEPVAHYLVAATGLTDRTPAAFTEAVDEGHDPAPADVATMVDLIKTHAVATLLFAPQTATAVTERIKATAEQAGIPVVNVTETLPPGTDYLTWQRRTVDALSRALGAPS